MKCVFYQPKMVATQYNFFPDILNCVYLRQMSEVPADGVTLDLLRGARETVRSSPLGVINTPMIPWCQTTLPLDIHCNIHIKLENMQRTGQRKPL